MMRYKELLNDLRIVQSPLLKDSFVYKTVEKAKNAIVSLMAENEALRDRLKLFEVRRGRWNYRMRAEHDHVISCSACGYNVHFFRKEAAMDAKKSYYECPKCRADMRGREENA